MLKPSPASLILMLIYLARYVTYSEWLIKNKKYEAHKNFRFNDDKQQYSQDQLLKEQQTNTNPDCLHALNIHRLVLTSLLIATKWYDDTHFDNASFARAGGIPCEELNQLETKFFDNLNLYVSQESLKAYLEDLQLSIDLNGDFSLLYHREPDNHFFEKAILKEYHEQYSEQKYLQENNASATLENNSTSLNALNSMIIPGPDTSLLLEINDSSTVPGFFRSHSDTGFLLADEKDSGKRKSPSEETENDALPLLKRSKTDSTLLYGNNSFFSDNQMMEIDQGEQEKISRSNDNQSGTMSSTA